MSGPETILTPTDVLAANSLQRLVGRTIRFQARWRRKAIVEAVSANGYLLAVETRKPGRGHWAIPTRWAQPPRKPNAELRRGGDKNNV